MKFVNETLISDIRVVVAGEKKNRIVFSIGSDKVDLNWLKAEVPHGSRIAYVYLFSKDQNIRFLVNGKLLDTEGKAVVLLNNDFARVQIEVIDRSGEVFEKHIMVIRTIVDPENPFQTMEKGVHAESVTLFNGEVRSFISYVPDGARENTSGIYVVPDKNTDRFSAWKNLADQTDTQRVDEIWNRQQEKFIVIYLNEMTYGTTGEERAADIEYINKVQMVAASCRHYCICEAKHYLVGYGEGGTIAQMAAADASEEFIWAGLVTVGAGKVNSCWLEERGEEFACHLHHYIDPESKMRKKMLPMPIWFIDGRDKTDRTVLDYWLAANKINADDFTEDERKIKKYIRKKKWEDSDGDTETLHGRNRDLEAYRIWVSDIIPDKLEETVWFDFLSGVRRWVDAPGGDLRLTRDPIAEKGMCRYYEKVNGYMREWYVYVPDHIASETKKVPLVFVNHGYSGNGGLFAEQTQFYKVADKYHFIAVFPTAHPNNNTPGGNIPLPYWNISTDPTRVDDISFFRYMIDHTAQKYQIDRGRIYTTGVSWGSQISHTLCMNAPGVFAAAAMLSGFMFHGYTECISQVERSKERVQNAGGVPVYIITGTAGEMEKVICPLPPLPDNGSGKTLQAWCEMNGTDEPVNWDAIGRDWKDNPAYWKEGRWYGKEWGKEGVPMVRLEIVDGMPHATMYEENERVWEKWFRHFKRNKNGELIYC